MKTPTKRYLLFMGDIYYPSGGWSDLRATSDSLLALFVQFLITYHEWGYDWAEIVDTQTGDVLDSDLRRLDRFIRFAEGVIK